MLRRALAVAAVVSAVGAGCAHQQPQQSGSGMGSEGDSGLSSRDRGVIKHETGSPLASVYFDFDEFKLRNDAQSTLKSNAQLMRDNPSWQIQIEGNCDERGSDEYNLALGKKRAEAAKHYLTNLGIDSTRIATISYGEENPAAQGHDEMAWSKNRRDDFVLR